MAITVAEPKNERRSECMGHLRREVYGAGAIKAGKPL